MRASSGPAGRQRFEASKTEAVLLSKRWGHIREGGKHRPGGREEGLFAREATRPEQRRGTDWAEGRLQRFRDGKSSRL